MTEERAVVLMQQVTGSGELKLSLRNINDLLRYFIEQYTLKIINTLYDLCCYFNALLNMSQCNPINLLIKWIVRGLILFGKKL